MKNPLARAIRYERGFPVLPGAFPIVGHLPAIYHNALEILREGERTLGPLFWSCMLMGEWALFCGGQEAFSVLKSKATSNQHLKAPTKLLFGNFMLLEDDPQHRHLRSAQNGPFSPRGLTTSGIGTTTAGIIEARVDRWAKQGTSTILGETRLLTLEIIFQIVGIQSEDLPAWSAHYRRLSLASWPGPVLPGTPKYLGAQSRKWLDAGFTKIIQTARMSPKSETLLSALVHAKDDEGKSLLDVELIDNLRSLVLAGQETTASLMAWAAILLAQRPDAWNSLCAEVQRTPHIPTSPAELQNFPFAEAIFREVARLHAPVSLTTRKTTDWMTLHEHRIPPETILSISPALLCRDPVLYPDPDCFDPTRWLGRASPPSAIELAAFGGGPHFCLGYHLAWLEIVQLLVALALRLNRQGLRPRIGDGPAPQQIFFPLKHPTPGTKLDWV